MEPGALADLVHARAGFLGRGFYHPHSLIAFRILTNQKDDVINEAFFEKRLREAMAWREQLYPGCKAYRWIFGESDRLPGLIVDRFGDYATVQVVSAGMERFKTQLQALILKVGSLKGIVWRSDASLRELEGLPELPVQILGEVPERVTIDLENVTFSVDLRTGQKTGFYFDQRDNRQALAPFCKGKRVLDAFCYSGGFGIAAARAGAAQVIFADSSQPALELAETNATQNGFIDRSLFVRGDAVELLEKGRSEKPFDVISIDPPAYARSKKHLMVALKAYEKLNAAAMSLLPRGGILATSSCSHHVDRVTFMKMLGYSAAKAKRQFRVVELRSQAKDHPVLLSMPETEYLKFAILQVI